MSYRQVVYFVQTSKAPFVCGKDLNTQTSREKSLMFRNGQVIIISHSTHYISGFLFSLAFISLRKFILDVYKITFHLSKDIHVYNVIKNQHACFNYKVKTLLVNVGSFMFSNLYGKELKRCSETFLWYLFSTEQTDVWLLCRN